jgi:hypothetical protein
MISDSQSQTMCWVLCLNSTRFSRLYSLREELTAHCIFPPNGKVPLNNPPTSSGQSRPEQGNTVDPYETLQLHIFKAFQDLDTNDFLKLTLSYSSEGSSALSVFRHH